jgi:hypothetical protein
MAVWCEPQKRLEQRLLRLDGVAEAAHGGIAAKLAWIRPEAGGIDDARRSGTPETSCRGRQSYERRGWCRKP